MGKELWNSWPDSIHQTESSKKKIQKAKSAECTPASVDKESCVAIFERKDKNYTTYLNECNCSSFGMDKNTLQAYVSFGYGAWNP